MEFLQNWVLVVCVIAFTLCVIGGLAILFERWTPSNPHTSKFLVTGVLASAVAAATPQGGDVFNRGSASDAREVIDSGTDVPGEGQGDGGDTAPSEGEGEGEGAGPTGPDNELGSDEGAGVVTDDGSRGAGTQNETPSEPVPGANGPEGQINLVAKIEKTPEPSLKLTSQEVEWARSIELKPRPFFADPFDFGYPSCLGRIKAALPDGVVTPEEAEECNVQLEEFNDRRILTHQRRRQPYIKDLKLKSENLEDEQIWQFVQRELFSYSDAEGVAYKAFYELGRRYKCDSGLLTNIEKYQLYRPPLLEICQANRAAA